MEARVNLVSIVIKPEKKVSNKNIFYFFSYEKLSLSSWNPNTKLSTL